MALQDVLRRLPGVDVLLASPDLEAAVARHGRELTVAEARRQLGELRDRARAAPDLDLASAALELPRRIAGALDSRAAGGLVEVLNATGVLVHTNLGRAPLGEPAVARMEALAREGVNLEIDLEDGRRGRRAPSCEDLLAQLCGAEAACVVNNNAAALLLALATFAAGKGVLASRGELVEIGGSFRIPDVCERSGARLVEVGTTNRTRIEDYRRGLDADPQAALLLKVHPSNFRVVGFTQETTLEELVALGRERELPVVMDQGSGALQDLSAWGVVDEPSAPELVATGADLVLFSGDKLLGGPQAGCMVGRRAAVEACRRNPLFRALRVGRLVAAALEATLWSHATGRHDEVPVQARLRASAESVRERAEALARALEPLPGGLQAEVVAGESTSGGGSSPTSRIPTWLVAVSGRGLRPDDAAAALRRGRPSVLARIADGALVLDLRTVSPGRDADVASAVVAAIRS